MAIETLAARTGATPLRIRRVQKITLTLLFIAGIVNFLDRSSLSVAGRYAPTRALAPPRLGCCSPPFRSPTASRATALRYFVGSPGPRIVLGAGLIFLVHNAGPDRDGQFVLAFYSAAHWPDRRSAVYASRREIDQRLVCAKRAARRWEYSTPRRCWAAIAPPAPGHHAVGLGLANDVCGDWFSRDRGRPVLVCGLP